MPSGGSLESYKTSNQHWNFYPGYFVSASSDRETCTGASLDFKHKLLTGLLQDRLTNMSSYSRSSRTTKVVSSGGQTGDLDLGHDLSSSKTTHRYQVYRGMSPTTSNRLEVRNSFFLIHNLLKLHISCRSLPLEQSCYCFQRGYIWLCEY